MDYALQFDKVLIVPPKKRQTLLDQSDDVYIQSEDTDTWERPSQTEVLFLNDYLNDNYGGAPKRFWIVRVGTRIGYNDEGVFVMERHQKRYFGLEAQKASVALQHCVEGNVPHVNARGERQVEGTKTEQILGKMLTHLPTLTDDMRYTVLRASFVRADRNGNGKLSRPELGTVLRRVLYTLKSADIDEVLRTADVDGDGCINCQEFVGWLQKSANSKISKAFGTSLRDEADIVRATFRQWDKNGDGLVPNGFLLKALEKVHPGFKHDRLRALVQCMDCDRDGNVDYDEFVDFLFKRSK